MHYMHTFLDPAWLAYAFLARVLRIARASLDRVLSEMAESSLYVLIARVLINHLYLYMQTWKDC